MSMLNFYLISKDVRKVTTAEQKGFTALLVKRYFLRYMMLALAIICVVKYKLHIVLFIAGFFVVQGTLIIDNTLRKQARE